MQSSGNEEKIACINQISRLCFVWFLVSFFPQRKITNTKFLHVHGNVKYITYQLRTLTLPQLTPYTVMNEFNLDLRCLRNCLVIVQTSPSGVIVLPEHFQL